jgi:dTDP-4-dehydrorhamnose 3,5-epimerase
MSRFAITETSLDGVKVIERRNIGDSRGFFSRVFCAEDLAEAGWIKPIAQINLNCTARSGSVRGLHFQLPPHAEMKLVNCVRGRIWDIAVDLRAGSPTFLKWHAEELSAENRRALLIPEGFAHGFQTLTDDCEVLYMSSHPYAPNGEGGVRPDDPAIAVEWPLPFAEISERDRNHPLLDADFAGINL